MTDEPFYSPTLKQPAPRTQPRPGELLLEFVRESDHAQFRCELRYHGEYGVEAQFFQNGELLIGRRFDTKSLAVQWAELEREHLEKGPSEAQDLATMPCCATSRSRRHSRCIRTPALSAL